ncbi:MAG: flotillin-like protein FloA [Candidatus Kuenenia sp.]|nr:flotillin-like protein FloA [Candidatus Kuenenia hertensis]
MQYLPFLLAPTSISLSLYLLLFLFICFSLFIIFTYGRFYINALSSGAAISLSQIIGMAIKRIDVKSIVKYRIMAKKVGIDIAPSSLEAHYLAGGNVDQVVRAIIAASKANIELSFDNACAIDLAGRNIFDIVKTSIYPKEFACPDPAKGTSTLDAITKDGIQIKVKARITLRTNIEKLVGSATEETIAARVGENIITAIGSSDCYKKVLERPDLISRYVMEKKLDADTAFTMLSVNIIDITVGENIGAKLQSAQIRADTQIALAETEKRKEAAIVRQHEIKALAEESRVKILAAEAEVPKAIVQAFREGNMGIMDYYHIKNIEADTEMKSALSRQKHPLNI